MSLQRSRWQQGGPRATRMGSQTGRGLVVAVVLIGSLGIYAVERWMRPPDAPIIGNAFVVDGDTLNMSGTRIRLIDIDAPELDQTCMDAQGRDWLCGRQVSAQLRSHVRGRDLTCQPKSRDQYGRVLATCSLPDGSDINAWMVHQGWAVTYGYADVYGRQQAEAKSAKRGLWNGSFMLPREWRHEHPRVPEGDHSDRHQ